MKHKKESRRGGKGNPKSGEDKIQADMNENETKEEEKSSNITIDKPEDKAEDKPSEVIANPVIKLDNGGTKNIPKPGPEKKTADKKTSLYGDRRERQLVHILLPIGNWHWILQSRIPKVWLTL